MDLNKLILTVTLCGLPAAYARCAGDGFSQNIQPDGVLDTTVEECDDGNLIPGDGCNQFCEVENLIFVSVDDELAIQCFHPADQGALIADLTRDASIGVQPGSDNAMAVPRGFTNLMFGRTLETMQIKGQGATTDGPNAATVDLLTAQPIPNEFHGSTEATERVGTVFGNDHGYEALDPFGDRCYLVDYMQVPLQYLNGANLAVDAGTNVAGTTGFGSISVGEARLLSSQVRSIFYPGEEFPDIVWHPHYDAAGAAIPQDADAEQFYSVQNCRSHLLDWRPKSVTTQFPIVNNRDATAVYPASQSHERLLHHFHDAYLTERCPQTPALDQRYQPESEAQLPEWTANYFQTPAFRLHGFGESYRGFLAADRTAGFLGVDAGTALGGSGEPVDARLFQPASQSVGFWEGCAIWTTPGVDTFLTFDVSGMFVDQSSNRWATMFLMWDDPDDAADNCPAMIDITLQNNGDLTLIPSNEGVFADDSAAVAPADLFTGSISARKYPICGDGFVDWPFESCEPDAGDQTHLPAFTNHGANQVNAANIPAGATCTAWCTQEVAAGTETCGNGIVEGEEICDAGEAGFDGFPHHDWSRVWGVGQNGVASRVFNNPITWRTAGCNAAAWQAFGGAAAAAGTCDAGEAPVYSAVLGCSGNQGGDANTQCMPQYAWAPGPDVANTAGGVKGATRFTGSRITNLSTKAGTGTGSTTANIRGDGTRHLRAVQRFEWRVPGTAVLANELFSPWRHPIHRIMMDPEVSQGIDADVGAGGGVGVAAFQPTTNFPADGLLTAGVLAAAKAARPAGLPQETVELTDCPALNTLATLATPPAVAAAGQAFGVNPLYGSNIDFNPNTLFYGSFPECGDFPQQIGTADDALPFAPGANRRPGIVAEADLFRFDDLSRWVFDPVQMCIYSGLCTAPTSAQVDISGAASFYGTNYFVQTPRAYKVLNAPFVNPGPGDGVTARTNAEAVDESVFFTRGLKNRDFPTPWYSMCLMHNRRQASPAESTALFRSFSDRRVFKVSPWKVQPEKGCGAAFAEGGSCSYIPGEEALITAADTLLATVTPLVNIDPTTGLRFAAVSGGDPNIESNPTLYRANPAGAVDQAFGDWATNNVDDWREAGLWFKAPAYGDATALALAGATPAPPATLPWTLAQGPINAGGPVGTDNFFTPFSWVLTQYKQRNLMVFQLRDPVYRQELQARSECAGVGFAASGSANARTGGKCINPRREAMCGKNVYRLGVEQCCNAERSLVRRINFEVFTNDNNAPRRESGCPCIKDNRQGHFRWWVIDQSIGCPAGESCCSGNQHSDDDTGRSIDVDSGKIEVGRCHNSATSKCCDTGCIYNPAAEQCCVIGQSYGLSRDLASNLLVGLEGLGYDPTIARDADGAATTLAGAAEENTAAGMPDLTLSLYRILNANPKQPDLQDGVLNQGQQNRELLEQILTNSRLTNNPGIQSIDEPCLCEDDNDCKATPTSVCCYGANPWGGASGANNQYGEPIPFLPQPYAAIPQCSRYHQYPLNFDTNTGFGQTQRADFDFQDGLDSIGTAAATGAYRTASVNNRGAPDANTVAVADPRKVENLKIWKQAMLPLTCRGKCIDSRYQMCCQGQVCAVEYQTCCNSTCCNRFSETCVTRRKSQSVRTGANFQDPEAFPNFNTWFPAPLSGYFSGGNFDSLFNENIDDRTNGGRQDREFNSNGIFEEYDVCTEIEALDVLKAFYVFVLPTIMLVFSFVGFAIAIIYANRITGRNFKTVERILVLIGTALVIVAMPLYFSPQYKYGALATLLGLFTVFVAASRIRTAHGILVIVYLVSVLYFVDPFAGNQFLSLNSERHFNEFNTGFVANERSRIGDTSQDRASTNSQFVNMHGSGLMASLTANFPAEWQWQAAAGQTTGQTTGCADAACTVCRDGYEWFRLPRVSAPAFERDSQAITNAAWAAGNQARAGTAMTGANAVNTLWSSSVNLQNWLWPSVPDTFLTTRTFGNTARTNSAYTESNVANTFGNAPTFHEVRDGDNVVPTGICIQKRCTEFYLGFFQRDTKRAYDFERIDNMHETRFGFCSRGWITALLVFGGLVVLLVLLGLVAAVFALLPRERPTEGVDLVIKDAYPVAAEYGGNERFNE